MSFYVTLTSNANTEIMYNSLTNFTNIFSEPLKLHGLVWEVGLHSIYCSNQFKESVNRKITFIHILCSIIRQDNNPSQSLAILARPFHTNLYHEVKQKQYFPVNSQYLSDIRLKLQFGNKKTSVINQELLPGQPTIIVLHFRLKNMSSPLCVLHLESHNQLNPRKDSNYTNKFAVELEAPLRFSSGQNIEVAISDITYQPYFQYSDESHYTIKLYDYRTHEEVWSTIIDPYTGDANKIYSYVAYIGRICDLFNNAPSKPNITCRKEGAIIPYLTLLSDQPVEIGLPYSLLFNMGERNFEPKYNNEFRIRLAPANTENNGIVNTYKEIHKFEANADPTAFYPEMGFVYCDFIKYNIMGESYAPILKAFPIEKKVKDRNYTTYTTESLEFYSISKYDLSVMNFDIRDVTGNFLPFKDNYGNIIITLVFREI